MCSYKMHKENKLYDTSKVIKMFLLQCPSQVKLHHLYRENYYIRAIFQVLKMTCAQVGVVFSLRSVLCKKYL